jgi:hypothetical protein
LLPEKNWTRWFYMKGKIALLQNKQATFQAVPESAKRKSLQFLAYCPSHAGRFHMRSWSFWFFVQILGFQHRTDEDCHCSCSIRTRGKGGCGRVRTGQVPARLSESLRVEG